MLCLHDGLSKQDQVTGRLLGRKLQDKGKILYRAAYHHIEMSKILDSWPSLITSAQHIPECIQLPVFAAIQHSYFLSNKDNFKKSPFLQGNWT